MVAALTVGPISAGSAGSNGRRQRPLSAPNPDIIPELEAFFDEPGDSPAHRVAAQARFAASNSGPSDFNASLLAAALQLEAQSPVGMISSQFPSDKADQTQARIKDFLA